MKIALEVSNCFRLELESGSIYHIREDGSGKLAITSYDNNNIVIGARQGAEQLHKGLGSYHEVIID